MRAPILLWLEAMESTWTYVRNHLQNVNMPSLSIE